MVGWIAGVLPLVISLLRWIAVLSSVVYVGGYIRDIYTKVVDENIQDQTDEFIQQTLDDPNLTNEQKTALIDQYLNNLPGNTPWFGQLADSLKYIIPAALVFWILMENKKS